MKVDLVCFSKLAEGGTCDYREARPYDLEQGGTLEDLMRQAGIEREAVKIAFINRRIADFDTVLQEGDRVGLSPAVGGM